jgi:hypothetical protein
MSNALSIPPPLPTSAAAIVRRDFPGWLSPMLVKELRQGLRTRGFVAALMIFQTVMLVLMLGALAAQSTISISGRPMTGMTTGFFWTLMLVQLIVVTPARALGGLQLEVESRTLDLLMLTRLNAWRVVLGKWISLLVQGALLLLAMLPYLVVRYFTDNADVLADFGRCLAMLGLCGVLTAAGLWASGIAKLLRVAIVILLVFGAQALGVTLTARMFGTGSPFGRIGVGTVFDSPFIIIDAVLLTAFFLVSAVRNIAPPAENHSFFVRMLPVVLLLTVPLAQVFGAHDIALQQLMIGAIFLAFVVVFELALARQPMPPHWREWRRRGPVLRFVGRASMPGWPSGLLWGVGAAALWALLALIHIPNGSVSSRHDAEQAAHFALLALGGLTFPVVLRSLWGRLPGSPLFIFFAGLALPALLALFSVWLAEGTPIRFTGVRSVMQVLPVSSFLLGLDTRRITPFTSAAAATIAIATVAFALWQARGYWRLITEFDARDRGEAPRA